jgi:hypothetical protein
VDLLEWIELNKGDKPGHQYHGNQYGGGHRAAAMRQADFAEQARKKGLNAQWLQDNPKVETPAQKARVQKKEAGAKKRAAGRAKKAAAARKAAPSGMGTASKKLRTRKAPAQRQFGQTPPVQAQAKRRKKFPPNPSAKAVQARAGIKRAQPSGLLPKKRAQMSLAERRKRMG